MNLFVAGFIGSPAMNFATARLVRDDGPAVTFAGYRLPLSEQFLTARPGMDGYFGRELILGIRPSDFEDASRAEAGWLRMPVTAGVIEKLGSEIHVLSGSIHRRSSTPAPGRHPGRRARGRCARGRCARSRRRRALI